MSAEPSRDVSLINDEEVLRKMWQDTDDFGRKKEIRAHMYKIREARLRDFYNTGEVSSEIHKTTTTKTTTEKSCDTPTHADSLADHSFLSMKTKEIRDSESPTRDVNYRVTNKRPDDQGWTVVTSNATSDDGKTHTTTRTATTSGSEKIVGGGQMDYSAKTQQEASVYKDGDDKNFKKAVGAKSNTVIKQEASGGDENSSFKMSSTSTTSSSKFVSEQHSSDGNIIDNSNQRMIGDNQRISTDKSIVSKSYTNDTPQHLRNHPNYVDGKTKVTQETHTMPDGTVVTTTKYETKSGNSIQTSTTKQYSNTSQQQSSSVRRSSATSTSSHISNKNIQGNFEDTKALRNIQKENDQLDRIGSHGTHTKHYDSKNHHETNQRHQEISQHHHHHDTTERHHDTTQHHKNIEYHHNEKTIPQTDLKGTHTTTTTTTVTKSVINSNQTDNQPKITNNSHTTTESTVIKHVGGNLISPQNTETRITKNNKNEINEKFINIEQQHFEKTIKQDSPERQPIKYDSPEPIKYQSPERHQTKPVEHKPKYESPKRQNEPKDDSYEMPDRRQPIKPGKSELDRKPEPTQGQYDTTYRSEFTNKRISVELSPTHEAFARSLRAVSPDRISKCSSPSRNSLRTSTNSLRSNSTSPEKKLRSSPERRPDHRSVSPKKLNTARSNETITLSSKTDTFTRRNKEIDSSTLTKRTKKSRSPSPTSIASDIEFIRNVDHLVTDLDTNETTIVTKNNFDQRTRTVTNTAQKTTKKITDRSPTFPITDLSPNSASPRRNSLGKNISLTLDKPKFKRTDTYEERCKEILGLTNQTDKRRDEKSTTRKSPTKDKPKVQEFPLQIRKSPQKEPLEPYPERKSPTKDKPKVQEFPSQIRKSPQKEPLEPYPERKSPTKDKPKVQEFPSQIRKSPQKEPLEPYPERKSPTKEKPKVQEFPSQIRKSPQKEPLEPYPERKSPTKDKPKVQEFPSQIRKSPQKEPLEPYPERKSPTKDRPQVSEFPSQIRKSPEREPLEPYPERKSPTKDKPKVQEFPSQIRKSPQREPLEPYPERKSPTKDRPQVSEFPSQIRKSPEREPLEPYPERKSPVKTKPQVNEFPSQVRKSPQREPLEPYPERKSPAKDKPQVCEFPSQIRKSPEKETLEPYPERKSPTKDKPQVCEFPSQIRKSPEKEPLEPYPERKSPTKNKPQVNEFPSQIRRSPEKEHLEPYPERKSPKKDKPQVNEFPSQIRKSPEKETLGPYPEKKSPNKEAPKICEFPSQIRKSSQKELLEPYPERKSLKKDIPQVQELSSQIRKSPERQTFEEYPERVRPIIDTSKIHEFPSQIRKSPERTPLEERYPERKSPERDEFPEKLQPIYGIPSVTEKDKPKHRTESESSTTTEEEEEREEDDKIEIEEVILTKKMTDLDEKIPVNEPIVTKKFINQLCKDEELQKVRTVKTKKLDEEISSSVTDTKHKTVKKDLSAKKKVLNETFIEKEKIDAKPIKTVTTTITKKISSPISKKPSTVQKKEPNNLPKESNKPVISKDVKKKTTVYDVKNQEVKTTTHMRNHRTDDLTTKTVINDKKTVVKKITEKRPSKLEEPIKKPVSAKTVTTTTPKRHVVTATINVATPKIRTNKKLVTKTKTTKTKLQNGHISSSDSENESIVDSLDEKVTIRRRSDQIITTSQKQHSAPIRGVSKPELIATTTSTNTRSKPTTSTTTKTEKQSVTTTKSILINNDTNLIDKKEIIVDLQRSKSSREPTPDRLCPLPLSSDDDELGLSSKPRYPDQITEPDDSSLKRNKPKRLSDLPIFEDQDQEVNRLVVEETDDVEEDISTLSINKKINKFLETTEKLTKSEESSPAPKIDRSKLELDKNLDKNDECLLSVSEKVNRFISTAEQLTSPQFSERPKSPKCQNYPEKTNLHDEDDECLLSVSDKVTKFITTADKLKKQPISLERMNIKSKQENEEHIKRQSPTRQNQSPKKSLTPDDHVTPNRRPPSTDKDSGKGYPRRDSSPKLPDTTPKTSRRPSEDNRSVLSSTGRLRSTETVKKAKALFENITKDESTKITKKIDDSTSLKSTRLVMEKLRSRSPEPMIRSREQTPFDDDIPGYMRPLDRSLRPNSPHRDSINQLNKKFSTHSDDESDLVTKFGVTLKRTNSGKGLSTTTSTQHTMSLDRKKSGTEKVIITEEEIEEIYELEILEELLERVVGYDLRRKIRAQIRLVKQLISENKLETVLLKKGRPSDDIKMKIFSHTDLLTRKDQNERRSEYQSSYSSFDEKTTFTSRRSHSPDERLRSRQKSPDDKPKSSDGYQRRPNDFQKGPDDKLRSPNVREKSPDIKQKSPDTRQKNPVTRQKSPDDRKKSPEPREKSPVSKTTKSKISHRLSPERKLTTSKLETTNIFQTNLKKTVTPSSKIVSSTDDRPDWVKERKLKKTDNLSKKSSTTTTTTSTSSSVTKTRKETRRSSSPNKETKPTDIITSSYGVGPTDENGSPLFGLKALRSQNRTDTTKVQGTVIRSQYYSENGNEPIGEISITKYSTDPKDLGKERHVSNKGITSVTTTQKFGYKDTPSLKSLTKKKTDETETKTTSKVTRRGSVKALSQKFVDNAVETSKTERQSSYPKAGLILRSTSSFKENTNGRNSTSRESSPGKTTTTTTRTTITSNGTTRSGERGTESFLTNRSRITNVHDVINRMKAEDDGQNEEEIQAKSLLNKFIGSQVILSGLESASKQQTTRKSSITTTTTSQQQQQQRSMKITTTVLEGGKPIKKTCTYQIPITEDVLKTIWDEDTIRLLLEQSTDYEERRKIRTRLHEIMEDKEACRDLVEKLNNQETKSTTNDGKTNKIEGESLLLPLLQGLLEAPDNEQINDSGIESGEDQRNNLINEVQLALDKLSTNLRNESSKNLTQERRNSLLKLVTKLQLTLATTSITPSSSSSTTTTPSTSNIGRYRQRKQRLNRHTVGVSSEELADARRLIEEISFSNNSNISKNINKVPLLKQRSEGSVVNTNNNQSAQEKLFKIFNFNNNKIKNATAKPFTSSSTTSISATSSSIQTPTESIGDLSYNDDKKINHPLMRHSLSLDYNNSKSNESNDLILVQQAVQQAAVNKLLNERKTDDVTPPVGTTATNQESETDDDTIKGQQTLTTDDDEEVEEEEEEEEEDDEEEEEIEEEEEVEEEIKDDTKNPKSSNLEYNDKIVVNQTIKYPKPDLIMQNNPIYNQDNLSASSSFDQLSLEEKCNRFNTKKLKMKRANTIDIPKPLKFYTDHNDDDDDDDDYSESSLLNENDLALRRHSNYLALRGPIRIDKNHMPKFQAKTENDKKFLAFINKQNDDNNNNDNNNTNKLSPWSKRNSNKTTIWNNKFDNIKTKFEKVSNNSLNTARNFWKTADDATTNLRMKTYNGPIISKQNARNLQQMFEEKQKQSSSNIVTGSLQFNTNSKKFQPKPLTVNQFSHAPQSAFKPINKPSDDLSTNPPIKTEIKTNRNDLPLFLYSPKPLDESTIPSPTTKPWNNTNKNGEHRVLNLAAKKFESPQQPKHQIQEELPRRKFSKEKIFVPQQHQDNQEKLTAPYLVKSVDQKQNTVRKLSGQYDSFNKKNDNYSTYTSVKYVSPQVENMKNSIQSPQSPKIKQFPNQSLQSPKTFSNDFQQSSPYYKGSSQEFRSPTGEHTSNQQFVSPNPLNRQYSIPKQLGQYSQDQQQYNTNQNKQYSQNQQKYNQNHQQYGQNHQQYGQNHQQYYENHHKDNGNQQFSQDQQRYGQNHQQYGQNHQKYDKNHQQYYENHHQESGNQRFSQNQQQYDQNHQQYGRNHQQYYDNHHQHNENQQYSQQYPDNRQYTQNKTEQYPSNQQYSKQPQQYYQNQSNQLKTYSQPLELSPQQTDSPHTEEYTSTFVYQPQLSPTNSSQQSKTPSPILSSTISNQSSPRKQYETQLSNESIKEYTAVSSKVMKGPISQQAETIRQKSPMNRNEHEMASVLNLRNTLQDKISNDNSGNNDNNTKLSSNSFKYKISEKPETNVTQTIFKFSPTEKPEKKLSQNSFKIREAEQRQKQQKLNRPTKLKLNQESSQSNNKMKSWEVNEVNDSIVTSKFHIPVISVITTPATPSKPLSNQEKAFNKADTWYQICMKQESSNPNENHPKINRSSLVKSKSSHTLGVPKLFEAGMSKDEMLHKRKTMEAFMNGGNKSPIQSSTNDNRSPKRSSINRVKTSEKLSAYHHHHHSVVSSSSTNGLSRSRTLPDIVCPEMLDESNTDKAFEDLFKSKTTEETKKTVTEGPVTTTKSTVTTRVSTQQATKKTISPFAKFRQLDKQNSLNTPPGTPKTPSGSGPLFKFTDPNLNQSANTVKDRLLHWCRLKTKEYENIQLDNFSSSWADGLAFCALIHHFLPDAFDYNALTPKNRRHNFTLAFQVADEKADIAPLLDVDDMVATRKPDWKCVFTYVQSIYRRFKDEL